MYSTLGNYNDRDSVDSNYKLKTAEKMSPNYDNKRKSFLGKSMEKDDKKSESTFSQYLISGEISYPTIEEK